MLADSTSSRRARTASSRAANVPPSVLRGLESLARGNEDMLRGMLDGCPVDAPLSVIVTKLREVMGVARLGVSALLAQFFARDVLATYCQDVAGCSAGGSCTVLADRIERAWSKPNFAPLIVATVAPPAAGEHRKRKAAGGGTAAGDASELSDTVLSDKRVQRLKKQQVKQNDFFLHRRFKVQLPSGPCWGVFTRSWIDHAAEWTDRSGKDRRGCVRFEMDFEGGAGKTSLNLAVTDFEGPLEKQVSSEKGNTTTEPAKAAALADAVIATAAQAKRARNSQAGASHGESVSSTADEGAQDDDGDDSDGVSSDDDDSDAGSDDADPEFDADPHLLDGVDTSNILKGRRRRTPSVHAFASATGAAAAAPKAGGAAEVDNESSEEEEVEF